MQQALYELRLLLQQDIETRLQEIRAELFQHLESVVEQLSVQFDSQEAVEGTEADILPVLSGIGIQRGNGAILGDAVEIGAAILGRSNSGNAALRRLSGTILRRIGRNIGAEAGDWLFDGQHESTHYGQYQFSEQLLSGLLKAQRNQ